MNKAKSINITYFATTILSMIQITCSDPSFFEALFDILAEIFVVGIAWAVVAVESFLEIFAWCTALS